MRTHLALCLLIVWALLASAAGQGADQELSHAALFAPNTSFDYFAECGTPDAADPARFSLQSAAMLAQCSLLSYVPGPDFLQETLAGAGFLQLQTFAHAGTYAFLAENDHHRVVTFRGSESGDRTDYLTNSKFNQTRFTEHGTAHSGFVEALAHVSPELLQALDERREARPGKTVWLTGHSMGGALAILFAIENPERVDAVYPIGAPRTVGRELAEHASGSLAIFRVVNNNDIVPRLPAPPFYEHIGPTYFLTADRALLIDPPASKAWRERLRGHRKFLKKLVAEHWARKDFSAIPSDVFVDHSPRLYAEILLQLAGEAAEAQP